MLTILFRTIFIYVLLIATVRLMGKRQLGELEVSELVTTLLLSEIATLPIAEQNIPILYAVIPLITILTIEISLSILLLKWPKLKNLASARPSILIRHGKLDQKEMTRIRVSIDELISEVRQAGLATLSDVDYAILEQNGKISVIPKKSAQPPSAQDLKLDLPETGIVHVLVSDGNINTYNLQLLKLDRIFVETQVKNRGQKLEDVFFLGSDDRGKLYWIDREGPK